MNRLEYVLARMRELEPQLDEVRADYDARKSEWDAFDVERIDLEERFRRADAGHLVCRVRPMSVNARFDVDPEFLARLLDMPATSSITEVRSRIDDGGHLLVELCAVDSALPDEPGKYTPTVTDHARVWSWGSPE